MLELKELVGLVAVVLTFVGYIPYIRDIFRRKTTPHVFSWLVWGIGTGIVFALQVSAGAGPGAWTTLALTLILIFVFLLSLRYGHKDIRKIDIVFLLLALLAVPLWLVVEQPVLSIVLLVTIDMLGFAPTVRKSWNAPYSETLSFYLITTGRHALSIFALVELNIITLLFPATWVLANALFAALLIARRFALQKK